MTRKPYDDTNTELLFLSYKEWCVERDFAVDEAIFEQLADFVHAHGGFEPARSLWDRACLELLVKPRKLVRPVPIPTDFEAQINALTANQLLSKINPESDGIRDRVPYDAQWAHWYHRWCGGERPDGFVRNHEPELTARQWRSLPPDVAAIKMRDLTFRAQVDRLIARGEI